ncbi:MAG: hypothetical protein ACE5IY_13290 [bacterium]
MNRRISLLISSAALLLLAERAGAGAWPQHKHGLYFKLSSAYLHSTQEFDHNGDRLDIFQERIIYEETSFRDFSVSTYFEYGLSDRLTIVGTLPFKVLRSRRTEIIGGGALARIATLYTIGLSDLSLLGKFALLNGSFALSLQGGLKLPLGYEEKPSDDGAPLGTGVVDFEGHLLVGKSLYPLPAYLTGSVGYRHRTNELHDQLLATAEAGYTAGRFLIKVTVDALMSTIAPPDLVGQPVVSPLPGGGGALPNIIVGDQDIFKISPSLIYRLTSKWAVQGEVLHIYAGKNTVAGTIYSIGFIFQRQP